MKFIKCLFALWETLEITTVDRTQSSLKYFYTVWWVYGGYNLPSKYGHYLGLYAAPSSILSLPLSSLPSLFSFVFFPWLLHPFPRFQLSSAYTCTSPSLTTFPPNSRLPFPNLPDLFIHMPWSTLKVNMFKTLFLQLPEIMFLLTCSCQWHCWFSHNHRVTVTDFPLSLLHPPAAAMAWRACLLMSHCYNISSGPYAPL